MNGDKSDIQKIFYLVAAFLLFLMIMILLNIKTKSEWDFLSFFGSIIGGLLTLAGVILTINLERNKEYHDSLPDKIILADSIIQDLREFLGRIDFAYGRFEEDGIFNVSYGLLDTLIKSYQDLYKRHKYNAFKVSKKSYQILSEMQNIMINFRLWNNKRMEDFDFDALTDDEKYMDFNRMEKLHNDFASMVSDYEHEINNLMEQFNKYNS